MYYIWLLLTSAFGLASRLLSVPTTVVSVVPPSAAPRVFRRTGTGRAGSSVSGLNFSVPAPEQGPSSHPRAGRGREQKAPLPALRFFFLSDKFLLTKCWADGLFGVFAATRELH